ncbi:MAG: hypothetical protein HQL17_00155 [Candidatus Omnitrophica bacterium]|nr:hypothetical protein [Candidatus Omnitrophota bacterium]
MKSKFVKADGWVKVVVQTKVYALQAVYSAGYVMMDKAYFYLDMDSKDKVAVWLKPKGKADLDQLAMDFCQELLNYAHYFASLKVNAESMKLLLQRALFSAAPSLVKEAEEKEIQDLIKELEMEEEKENKKPAKKGKK